jgi:hypothetical protein
VKKADVWLTVCTCPIGVQVGAELERAWALHPLIVNRDATARGNASDAADVNAPLWPTIGNAAIASAKGAVRIVIDFWETEPLDPVAAIGTAVGVAWLGDSDAKLVDSWLPFVRNSKIFWLPSGNMTSLKLAPETAEVASCVSGTSLPTTGTPTAGQVKTVRVEPAEAQLGRVPIRVALFGELAPVPDDEDWLRCPEFGFDVAAPAKLAKLEVETIAIVAKKIKVRRDLWFSSEEVVLVLALIIWILSWSRHLQHSAAHVRKFPASGIPSTFVDLWKKWTHANNSRE